MQEDWVCALRERADACSGVCGTRIDHIARRRLAVEGGDAAGENVPEGVLRIELQRRDTDQVHYVAAAAASVLDVRVERSIGRGDVRIRHVHLRGGAIGGCPTRQDEAVIRGRRGADGAGDLHPEAQRERFRRRGVPEELSVEGARRGRAVGPLWDAVGKILDPIQVHAWIVRRRVCVHVVRAVAIGGGIVGKSIECTRFFHGVRGCALANEIVRRAIHQHEPVRIDLSHGEVLYPHDIIGGFAVLDVHPVRPRSITAKGIVNVHARGGFGVSHLGEEVPAGRRRRGGHFKGEPHREIVRGYDPATEKLIAVHCS